MDLASAGGGSAKAGKGQGKGKDDKAIARIALLACRQATRFGKGNYWSLSLLYLQIRKANRYKQKALDKAEKETRDRFCRLKMICATL